MTHPVRDHDFEQPTEVIELAASHAGYQRCEHPEEKSTPGEGAGEVPAQADTFQVPVVNAAPADKGLPVATGPVNSSTGDKPIAWLCGVHGGAGVSTLATMLAPFKDSGGVIPAADDPHTTILVAATHKAGLRAAHDAVLQFNASRAGGAELLGVILVDHVPGKLPKALVGDVERIREATPGHNVWQVGYVEAWRCARLVDLPEWTPSAGEVSQASGKKSLGHRRTREDPLRQVPSAVGECAQEIFDRALRLYRRLNS